MNKDDAKHYLPLVQALAEGHELEFVDSYGTWSVVSSPSFGFPPERYRVKPELIEGWVNVYPDNRLGPTHATEDQARSAASHNVLRTIKVREVEE